MNKNLNVFSKIILLIIITFFSFLFLSKDAKAMKWKENTINTLTSSFGKEIKAVVDSKNKIHFIYYNNLGRSLQYPITLYYATNAYGPWISTGIDRGFLGGSEGRSFSLAIDSNGKAHISYYDDKNGNLKYATNASGKWVSKVLDDDGDTGFNSSIAVDSNNKVHISYNKVNSQTARHTLKYITNVSGQWTSSTLDEGTTSPIMVVDSNNKIHLAYIGGYASENISSFTDALVYVNNVSGEWVYTGIDESAESFTTDNDLSISIALDANSNVHISYYNEGDYSLKYATNTSGSWVTTIVDNSLTDLYRGRLSSFVTVNSNNNVRILYSASSWRITDDPLLKYATNALGAWSYKTLKKEYTSGFFDDKKGGIHTIYEDKESKFIHQYLSDYPFINIDNVDINFTTKSPMKKEILIERGNVDEARSLEYKTYSTYDARLFFSKIPNKIKKEKYYLRFRRFKDYPPNYPNSQNLTLKKYWRIKTNLNEKKLNSSFRFYYIATEFKKLKKQNNNIKKDNLNLKYYNSDTNSWQNVGSGYSYFDVTFNEFPYPIIYFAIGKE